METKELKIIAVEEKKTKDGKKFNVYTTLSKNGRKLNLKFRQNVKNLPTEPCIAVVQTDHISVDKSRQYMCVWVHEDPLEYKSLDEDRKLKNKATLDELFD